MGYRGGRYHRYGNGIESRIVQCRGCLLLFPDPFPYPCDPQQLYGDPSKYFALHNMSEKVAANRALIRDFRDRMGTAEISLLDVGSGRGEMLAAAQAEGIVDVVGLELSKAMIDASREAFGATVLPATVEEFSTTSTRKFDAIVLNAVLEHVYDPNSMIAACRRLLSPGGILYLDVPNEDHLLAQVGGWLNRIRGHEGVFVLSPTFSPFHVFGFSPQSLRILLAKHGFFVERLDIHAGAEVSHRDGWKDRAVAAIGTVINRLSNRVGRSHNMYVWAKAYS